MRIQRTHLRHPLASVPRRSGELTSAFDRLFDDVFQGAFGRTNGAPSPQNPRFDLLEDEASYELTFELPGIDPEVVELRLDDGQLHLRTREVRAAESTEVQAEGAADGSAESEADTQPAAASTEAAPGPRVLHRGRRGGAYELRLRLPEDIDLDAIEAVHDLGLLHVRLPKLEAHSTSRVIPVVRR
jgi:HSP20 family molecular chaperone IbpA